MKNTSEVTQEFKTVTHIASILFVPLMLGVFISSQNSLAKTGGAVLVLAVYILLLYSAAGGFSWELREISRLRLLTFLFLSGFSLGILLYGIWYVIRKFEANMFNIPFEAVKGRLFSGKWTESETFH